MATGFTSVGAHGFFQIDENNPHLVLVARGITTPYSMLNCVFSSATFSSTSFPAVFIRPNGSLYGSGVQWHAAGAVISVTNNNNGTYTAHFIGGPFEYYAYANPLTSDRFGLEIHNANNVKIFHSNAIPLKIAGIVDVPLYSDHDVDHVYGSLPSKKYAACWSAYSHQYVSSGTCIVTCLNVVNTGIRRTVRTYNCAPAYGDWLERLPITPHVIFADVSEF